MILLDDTSKLSLLVDIQTIKNVLAVQLNKEKQKLINIAKEYLLFLVEINKEMFNDTYPNVVHESLKSKLLEVQFSFREFCTDVKKLIDIHSLSAQFVSPQGGTINLNVTLDYGSLNSFVNERFLETTRLYFQLDHKVDESIKFIERKSFFKQKCDELSMKMVEVQKTDDNDKLGELKIDIESILTLKDLEKAFENLELTKENHEKVLDKRLKLEILIKKQKLFIEHEKLKAKFDTSFFEKAHSTLKGIYYGYFDLLRKLCYLLSSIKDKKSISHAKVEERLNKTLNKLDKFNFDYNFFTDDSHFLLSIPGSTEKLQFNLSSKNISSDLRKTMKILKGFVPSYDLELFQYFKMEGKDSTISDMKELYSNISLVENKLAEADRCKVCLGEVELILNNIKELDVDGIIEKAAGLSLYYEGLRDEILEFDDGYKELYRNW